MRKSNIVNFKFIHTNRNEANFADSTDFFVFIIRVRCILHTHKHTSPTHMCARDKTRAADPLVIFRANICKHLRTRLVFNMTYREDEKKTLNGDANKMEKKKLCIKKHH